MRRVRAASCGEADSGTRSGWQKSASLRSEECTKSMEDDVVAVALRLALDRGSARHSLAEPQQHFCLSFPKPEDQSTPSQPGSWTYLSRNFQ